MFINSVQLRGNLGGDPVINTSKEGKEFASFSVATHESYQDRVTKEWKELPAEWFSCVALTNRTVNEAKMLKKGALVGIEGRLRNNEFIDKEGNKRQVVKVIITSLSEIIRREGSVVDAETIIPSDLGE